MAQNDVMLVRVDPRYPGAWDALREYLASAVAEDESGSWTMDDYYQAALEQRVALWAVVRGDRIFGAGVTTIAQYPNRRFLEVLAFGADAHTEREWIKLLEELKFHARALGADGITGTGRNGWARKLNATRTRRVWELDL